MGVRGLRTYIEKKIPDVIFPIDIEELVKNAAQKVDYRPTIIIDFKCCIPQFYHKPSLIYGGRLKELSSRIEFFINKITSAGGQVVAFYDGLHPVEKRENHIKGRRGKLKILHNNFRTIRRQRYYGQIGVVLITEAEDITAQCVLKTLQHCQLKSSTRECDSEMMEYMKTNQCLALITGDTDLLMFNLEHDTIYISSRYLDVDSMTSKAFNLETMRKHFNLRQTQMPLFATFLGNDFVPKNCLKYFRCNVLLGGDRFTAVANYVRKFPDDETIYDHLNDITDETHVSSVLLKKSLQKYRRDDNYSEPLSTSREWNQIMRLAREKLVVGELPPGLYDLLVKCNYLPPLVAEDPRTMKVDFFLQPLRRRIYDLLFLHYPSFQGVQEDHLITGEGVSSNVLPPRPLDYPGVSLLDLWTNENNRWGTFCNCIDTRIDVEVVTQIEKHLIIPSLALYYISNNESETTLFNKDEILSLIATIVKADESDPMTPDPSLINMRVVDVAAKFQQVCGTIYFLNGACGAPVASSYASPANYFDGDLFAYVFSKPVKEIVDNMSNKEMTYYQEILGFITI